MAIFLKKLQSTPSKSETLGTCTNCPAYSEFKHRQLTKKQHAGTRPSYTMSIKIELIVYLVRNHLSPPFIYLLFNKKVSDPYKSAKKTTYEQTFEALTVPNT